MEDLKNATIVCIYAISMQEKFYSTVPKRKTIAQFPIRKGDKTVHFRKTFNFNSFTLPFKVKVIYHSSLPDINTTDLHLPK